MVISAGCQCRQFGYSYLFTASFNALPALNTGALDASILITSSILEILLPWSENLFYYKTFYD